jgi:quercetin dioxygenase-like cupin family protein
VIQEVVRKIRVPMPSSLHKRIGKHIALSVVIIAAVVTLSRVPAKPSSNKEIQARIVMSHSPPRLNGRNLKVTVLEVNYGPGESAPPHSHPCPVVGYVLEGALRTQMKGASEAVYRAGESFYEPSNSVHQSSANASRSESVKFLAYFVCDGDAPLSVAASESPTSGGKQP